MLLYFLLPLIIIISCFILALFIEYIAYRKFVTTVGENYSLIMLRSQSIHPYPNDRPSTFTWRMSERKEKQRDTQNNIRKKKRTKVAKRKILFLRMEDTNVKKVKLCLLYIICWVCLSHASHSISPLCTHTYTSIQSTSKRVRPLLILSASFFPASCSVSSFLRNKLKYFLGRGEKEIKKIWMGDVMNRSSFKGYTYK